MKQLAAGLAVFAVLAACGSGGGPSQPSGSTKVTMTEYKFDPSTVSVPSGKEAVLYLVNAGSIAHDLVIKDSSGNRVAASELVSAGDSNVFKVPSLTAGTYTIICDQPGHESNGMKGTLTAT